MDLSNKSIYKYKWHVLKKKFNSISPHNDVSVGRSRDAYTLKSFPEAKH
jgi:hypothetical protein